jgi:iron complex transport system substrate-binding protein
MTIFTGWILRLRAFHRRRPRGACSTSPGMATRASGLPRRFLYLALLLLFFSGLADAAAAPASEDTKPPSRIVSINACTDQLVWALADPSQIAALSYYAADSSYFTEAAAVRASGLRLIRGSAEEVLKLHPDLVLAGGFTSFATRSWLKNAGIRLAALPEAESVEEAKEAVRKVAALTGHPERGETLIAKIDDGLRSLKKAGGSGISVLELQRRGFASGQKTLLGDLLSQAGLSNAASRLGIVSVSHIPLEAILKLHPDFLVMSSAEPDAADQGSALLLHPALAEEYPPSRRIILPENLTVCGGPSLPLAMQSLAWQIKAKGHSTASR